MPIGRAALLAPVLRWASRRRFPVLLALMLVLGAILVGRLRKRDLPPEAPPHEDQR